MNFLDIFLFVVSVFHCPVGEAVRCSAQREGAWIPDAVEEAYNRAWQGVIHAAEWLFDKL